MATNDDLKKDMVDLAKTIAQDAKHAEVLSDKIDALKTLTAVYVALSKHKTDDPDDTEGGFDFSRGVMPEEPTHGEPTARLPAGRRRPS